MTFLYFNGEANVVADGFIQIPGAHHTHKLKNTTLEKYTCENLYLESLLITDNTDYFCLNIEEISFPLAPQIVEVEQNMEL